MSDKTPAGAQGCLRCQKREYCEKVVNIAINFHAWATVLRTVIPLAEKNQLTVQVLSAMCSALRHDLLKEQTKRSNDSLFENIRTGVERDKFAERVLKAVLRVAFDPTVFGRLDLAVEPFYSFEERKEPVKKRVRRKRRNTI